MDVTQFPVTSYFHTSAKQQRSHLKPLGLNHWDSDFDSDLDSIPLADDFIHLAGAGAGEHAAAAAANASAEDALSDASRRTRTWSATRLNPGLLFNAHLALAVQHPGLFGHAYAAAEHTPVSPHRFSPYSLPRSLGSAFDAVTPGSRSPPSPAAAAPPHPTGTGDGRRTCPPAAASAGAAASDYDKGGGSGGSVTITGGPLRGMDSNGRRRERREPKYRIIDRDLDIVADMNFVSGLLREEGVKAEPEVEGLLLDLAYTMARDRLVEAGHYANIDNRSRIGLVDIRRATQPEFVPEEDTVDDPEDDPEDFPEDNPEDCPEDSNKETGDTEGYRARTLSSVPVRISVPIPIPIPVPVPVPVPAPIRTPNNANVVQGNRDCGNRDTRHWPGRPQSDPDPDPDAESDDSDDDDLIPVEELSAEEVAAQRKAMDVDDQDTSQDPDEDAECDQASDQANDQANDQTSDQAYDQEQPQHLYWNWEQEFSVDMEYDQFDVDGEELEMPDIITFATHNADDLEVGDLVAYGEDPQVWEVLAKSIVDCYDEEESYDNLETIEMSDDEEAECSAGPSSAANVQVVCEQCENDEEDECLAGPSSAANVQVHPQQSNNQPQYYSLPDLGSDDDL
ncbi:hypothetical protein KR018_009230 [Drosophila ironensis]|nr:hypothetical protein KR018_009230 [Drosophila ironensis]